MRDDARGPEHYPPAGEPGRNCPVAYRCSPAVLARECELVADTVYVIGGLYGNRPALAHVLEMAADEVGGAVAVFNGDFNWFNVDAQGFASVNRAVLAHVALRGNVETELAGEDASAGCGCGYPEWVGDAEVARSNEIMARLRETARTMPELRARLALLPMNLTARVGDARVAIVHGDPESLAGWGLSQEALAEPGNRERAARWLTAAQADVIASSHSCLPVACELPGGGIVINNGAAGMPNFRATRHGVVTRIGVRPARRVVALYSLRFGRTIVDALPVPYDHARFELEFLASWPAGSAAHTSYHRRIRQGPDYELRQAVRRRSLTAVPVAERHP